MSDRTIELGGMRFTLRTHPGIPRDAFIVHDQRQAVGVVDGKVVGPVPVPSPLEVLAALVETVG